MKSDEAEVITMVSDLVDLEKMEWDVDLIEQKFNEQDQKCILSIPLSWISPGDIITWAYSNDGKYSTKTTYMLGKEFR